ncbi:MAG: class I SAM-dependent methyltransferase [Puia sp.]|nr:class I SAM-dependent methyltransferase [Puia sp.]
MRSFFGHLYRLASGHLPKLPWLTWRAIRYLKATLPLHARVFEFGGGMSTLWYEDRYAEVHTVEDNFEWYSALKNSARSAHIYHCKDESFIESIDRFPNDYFDLIVVDGNFNRQSCFHRAEPHLKEGGLFVIDDSDKQQLTGGPIRDLDSWLETCNQYEIVRLTGWIPASFWVKETTIARRLY